MSKSKLIPVGVANEGQRHLPLEDIKKWEPKKVSHLQGSIMFEVEGTFYSMERKQYLELFPNHR